MARQCLFRPQLPQLPPIAPAPAALSALPAPAVLQRVSPNKRKFNTVEDAAVRAARAAAPAKPRMGRRLDANFGVARKARPAQRRPPRRHSYTREEKLKVIDFIADRSNWVEDFRPQVRVREGLHMENNLRPPTNDEVAQLFSLSSATVNYWWASRAEILQSSGRSRRVTVSRFRGFWPALEARLFAAFEARRGAGNLVSRGWFRRNAKALFREVYSTDMEFVFSVGWFAGFQRRWHVSRRRTTRQAQKMPLDQLGTVNSFLRFVRNNSWDPMGSRYCASSILNLDETPIPFEYLDGYTYDFVGKHTITGRSLRSGWGKRQATLILYVFADGQKRLLPKIIFQGAAGKKSAIRAKEGHLYHPGVTVEYNPKAWNNEDLFVHWLDEEYAPLRAAGAGNYLMVLDHAKGAGAVKRLLHGACRHPLWMYVSPPAPRHCYQRSFQGVVSRG